MAALFLFLLVALFVAVEASLAKRASGDSMNDMPGMNGMPGMKDMPAIPSKNLPTRSKPEDGSGPKEFGSGNFADADNAVSLAEFKHLAEKNNPTLLEASAQIKAENAKALQAGLWPNPQLQYSGELVGERVAGLGEFQGGGIQQQIRLGGKLHYSRLKYKARAEAAQAEYRAQQLRVMNDLESQFFLVLAKQEELRLQRELLKSTRDNRLTLGEMFNLGEADRSDLHEANIEVSRQELKVVLAHNQLELAWRKLACICGIAEAKYRSLKGEIYEIAAAEKLAEAALLKRLISETPVLEKARKKLRADELTVIRESRQPIPDLLVCAQAGYDQMNKSFATNIMASLIEVPVFNRNQGTIEQAKADLERQKARIKLLELQIKESFAEIYTEYLSAAEYVDTFKRSILPEARKRYELNLNSYRNLRSEWPDVLAAQKDYFLHQTEYVHHCFELKKAEIKLKGFLLSGALKTPEEVTPPGHIDATPQPR